VVGAGGAASLIVGKMRERGKKERGGNFLVGRWWSVLVVCGKKVIFSYIEKGS